MEEMDSGEVAHEDLINITEEADLLQAERIIDDFDPRDAPDRRQNKDNVRKLEKLMLDMNLDEVEVKDEENNSQEWEVNSPAGYICLNAIL